MLNSLRLDGFLANASRLSDHGLLYWRDSSPPRGGLTWAMVDGSMVPYLAVHEAAKEAGLSQAYLGRLPRWGALTGQIIGGMWVLDRGTPSHIHRTARQKWLNEAIE